MGAGLGSRGSRDGKAERVSDVESSGPSGGGILTLEGQTDHHVPGGRARGRARVWPQGLGKLAPEVHSLRTFFLEAAGGWGTVSGVQL